MQLALESLKQFLTGRVLAGRYRIDRFIDKGGMGAVFGATDLHLGCPVAVKVILIDLGDASANERLRKRFEREAKIAAHLRNNPNVCAVHDYGNDPETNFDFIVMDLLEGMDLSKWLSANGSPPLAVAVSIFRQITRGLAAGHARGIVHRDVKPGNVFVLAVSEHAAPEVMVLDFGVAKWAVEQQGVSTITIGVAPHTRNFASPEQLQGEPEVTPGSDVFSLGIMGYMLLTGRDPFTEADRNRMSARFPVPIRTPRELNAVVPEAVERIIMQCLEFRPEDRFVDARAILRALDASDLGTLGSAGRAWVPEGGGHAAGEKTETRTIELPASDRTRGPVPPSPGSPRREGTRGRQAERGSVLAAGAVILLLSGGAGVAWTFREPLLDFLKFETAEERTEDSPPVGPIVPPDPVRARLANEEGLRFSNDKEYEKALPLFQEAWEKAPSNEHYENNYGYALLKVGRLEEAQRVLEKVANEHPDRRVVHYNLGELYVELGDTAKSITSVERYIELDPPARGRRGAEKWLRQLRKKQRER